MKPFLINAINASVLIIVGLLGYFGSDTPSVTALIPVFAGVILLLLVKSMKDGNRVVAHIVVTLTLLLLIALIKPLTGAINRNDPGAVIRVVIMIVTNLVALVIYIKSFVDARRNRDRL
jgi:hypothetical protein